MTLARRILIAGVGNIFFGDDAFGVEVVRRLAGRPLPEDVRLVDFGIRGIDLTNALREDDSPFLAVRPFAPHFTCVDKPRVSIFTTCCLIEGCEN